MASQRQSETRQKVMTAGKQWPSKKGDGGRLMYLGEIPPTRETIRAVLEHVDGKGWSEEGYRAFKGLDLGVINGKSREIGFD